MAKLSTEWFRKNFSDYVTNSSSNAAYAMSFLTIFATIPLLALMIYISTLLDPLHLFALSMKNIVFEGFTPATEADLMPVIEGFLSNAEQLGIIGAIFGLYSSYLFFSSLDYWTQTIYKANMRSDIGIIGTKVAIIFSLSSVQIVATFIKAIFDELIVLEILNIISLWLSIFIVYLILPNAKVDRKHALIISLCVMLCIEIIKFGFVYYVKYAFSYKTIYGSFAAVMFLLIWIELVWWIFFMGLNALSVNKMEQILHQKI